MGIEATDINKLQKIDVTSHDVIHPAIPKTKPYPSDSVEISEKKQKKDVSVTKNVFATVGGIFGALVLVGLYIKNGKASKLTKLYNEKMVFAELPEKLEFKEAKTVEEGIKFAKEVLKIGEVDKEFSLDAINYANRGLVDVANANKGKLFMPKKLRYDNFEDEVAHVNQNINSSNFGELGINKQYFNDDFLIQKLKEYYPNSGRPVNRKMERKLALLNAGGLSVVAGALTTVIARSYTSSWKHAGSFGIGATAVAFMFLGPRFLYKSKINSYAKEQEMDVFAREKEVQKKLLSDVNEAIDLHKENLHDTLDNYSKTLSKKSA